MPRSDRAIAIACALAGAALYVLSGMGHPTPWTFFAPLARAFLEGRWWLTEPSPYLHELLPCGDGRLCVVYVPLPAFVVLPFTFFFVDGEAQRLASAIAGGVSAGPTFLVLRRLGAPLRTALLTTAFAIAGTTLWYHATDGKAWYFAHAVAVLLGTLALLGALSNWHPVVVGSLIGAAALARLPIGLAALGLALIVAHRQGQPLYRVVALGTLGMAPLAALEILYDLLRWGVPSEAGYALLAATEPYYKYGLFSLAYLPRHLYVLFMLGPHFVPDTPFFVRPSLVGMSLLLVSPAFAYAIAALRHAGRDRVVLGLALAAALPLVPDLLHGNVGWTQFGYRFALDAQPFLLPLAALGAAWRPQSGWNGIAPTYVALVAWSVLANLYGTLALIHFGYAVMEFPPL